MSAEVEMLPVFYAGRGSHRGKPSYTLSRSGCRELVESGLADWTNKKCGSIKLKRVEALARKPLSLQMGARVIEGHAEGKASLVAIVQAWMHPMRIAA